MKCPKCGTEISEALAEKDKEIILSKFNEENKRKQDALDRERLDFERNKNEYQKRIAELSSKEANLEAKIKIQISEQAEKEKSKFIEEYKHSIESQLKNKIEMAKMESANQLTQKDLELSRLRQKVQDLQNNNDQSQEMAGEIKENQLKQQLINLFPYDQIEDIDKGAIGADLKQNIRHANKVIGSILYESKNTKAWSNDWVSKLKMDQKNSNSNFSILVTRALPADMKNSNVLFKMDENTKTLFICDFKALEIVATFIRKLIVQESELRVEIDNVDDIKDRLYKKVTSQQFMQSLKMLNDYFFNFKDSLDKYEKQVNKFVRNQKDLIANIQDSLLTVESTIETTALLTSKEEE